MTTFTDPRLAALDGFRVEIDAARERADVILDRPPFNIVSMPQRDQLRLGTLLELRRTCTLRLERNRRSGTARVDALCVVQRLFAILIAAGKNAFPGEAVVHEIKNGARLGFRRAGSEHHCKQRRHTYTESKP